MNFASIKRRLRSLLSWQRPPSDGRIALGRRGERAAARHLKRRRYRILARNYRCAAGEIDLIASQTATIIFVEVKTRQEDDGGDERLPVHVEQRGRIMRAARYFLAHPAAVDRPYRFDVITVAFAGHAPPKIEHMEDAWQPRFG